MFNTSFLVRSCLPDFPLIKTYATRPLFIHYTDFTGTISIVDLSLVRVVARYSACMFLHEREIGVNQRDPPTNAISKNIDR